MKAKYTTALYFIFVFLGGGILLIQDSLEGEKNIVITIIALVLMMFGMYKVSSSLKTNVPVQDDFVKTEIEKHHNEEE